MIQFLTILLQSSVQALLSSLLSLLFGVIISAGLLWIPNSKYRKPFELLFLLPNFLPTLFVLISTLGLLNYIGPFPFGFWGVVIIHVTIHVGLIGVAITQLLENKMGNHLELAIIEGASFLQLWSVGLRAIQNEIKLLFFFVFVFCFASFSVPLIVGGGGGETLDVLIYKSVIGEARLNYGIVLALFQLILLGLISRFFQKPTIDYHNKVCNLKLMSAPLVLPIATVVLAALLLSAFTDSYAGYLEVEKLVNFLPTLASLVLGSFIECLLVATMTCMFFLAVVYYYPNIFLRSSLLALTAPNTILIGLGFYLIFDSSSQGFSLLIIAIAFTLTILPSLFRLKIVNTLDNVVEKIEMAQILGADRTQIFYSVSLPLVFKEIMLIAGMAGLWASGDFALSKMIIGKDLTLAMTAHTLIGGYRLESATFVTVCALMVGLFVFLLCEGIGCVYYKKSY